jgi:opacity protein-like surface antigen
MYKKVLMAVLCLISLQANAAEIKNKFYLGGSADLYEYSFYGVGGASVYAGYRWDILSLELGYSKPQNESWNEDNSITFKSNNLYLDGILSYPLGSALEAKGIVGLGVFHTKTYGHSNSWLYPNDLNETAVGVRAGLGLQYNFNKNWSADMTYKFQTNCNVVLGFMNIFSVGVKYHFG